MALRYISGCKIGGLLTGFRTGRKSCRVEIIFGENFYTLISLFRAFKIIKIFGAVFLRVGVRGFGSNFEGFDFGDLECFEALFRG